MLKHTLEELYHKDTKRAVAFRYGLLLLDIVFMVFIVASSFFYGHGAFEVCDVIFGIIFLLEIAARFYANPHRMAYLVSISGVVDMVVVVSLVMPLLGENFAFLRVIRTIRLLRSYQMLLRLRTDFGFFRANEDIIQSAVNLMVFIFVMTAVVFETQVGHNQGIQNYVDALYFTVATLTTTGFGDITLGNHSGKMLAIIIMIFGVSLFIRLIQTMFRSHKVRFACTQCGLLLHDRDAVHCKHCGVVLNIPNEGVY